MKGAFNQEKALVGAFFVIVKTNCETDGAPHSTSADTDTSEMLALVTVLVAGVRADLTASIRAAAPQLYTAAAAVTPEAANVAISPLSITSVLAR